MMYLLFSALDDYHQNKSSVNATELMFCDLFYLALSVSLSLNCYAGAVKFLCQKILWSARAIFFGGQALDSNNMTENQVASSFSFKIFERIKPDEYFRRFIEENVRPDGRALNTFRPTSIRQGAITTANGSAMVRIGGTTVVCGIKAEVAEPRVDRPKDGFLG